MTKLTEDILRAQTCPFEVQSIDGNRRMKITAIGFKYFLVLDEDREYAHRIDTVECYKLPEPEPKLVEIKEKTVEAWGLVLGGVLSYVSLDRDFKNIKERPTGFTKLEIVPLTRLIKE